MKIRCLLVLLLLVAADRARTAELRIGWGSTDITPDRPAALSGSFHTRISTSVHDPITATALVIESGGDHAVMVSVDLVAVDKELQQEVRRRLEGRLPGFNPGKLFLHATHTHTAPVHRDDLYEVPPTAIQPSEYAEFLAGRLVEAVIQAWNSRKPGAVSWALSYAVVGRNRRAVFDNGKAVMYGRTHQPDFRHIEGSEDHSLDLLFFWEGNRQALSGIVINVPCPSQAIEREEYISADFWSNVRTELRKRHGKDLFVYPMTGPSGDQSPHLQFQKRAEQTLQKRHGTSVTGEIARRIANAVDDVLAGARQDIHTDVPFRHKVEELVLPIRKVTPAEREAARKEYDRLKDLPSADRERDGRMVWTKTVIDRYARQNQNPHFTMELHSIRLGDIAIATNPFELFLDYAIRIKARSPAEQTFLIQLACDYGDYLPTERAVAAGGYGAEIASNTVGPEGGQMLVERTVEAIKAMWK